MVGRSQGNLFFISLKYQQYFTSRGEKVCSLIASQEKCMVLNSDIIEFTEVGCLVFGVP